MKKPKKENKIFDLIIMLVSLFLIIAMVSFALTRETSGQKIILMGIYKSAGSNTSSAINSHYYVYENTNTVEIRNENTNNVISKDIDQNLIDNFKNSLDEYISKNPTINTSFFTNERYTIEYNGASITIPNPTVVSNLGFDSNEYAFFNTIESFINTVNNT